MFRAVEGVGVVSTASSPAARSERVRGRLRTCVLSITAAVIVLWMLRTGALRTGEAESMTVSGWAAAIIFLAAFACEYVDSALGMGYGTTLTPLMMLVGGFEPMTIVPCILLSETVTGLFAGLLHHHDGNVDWVRDRRAQGVGLLLSMLSAVGAILAVSVAIRIPKLWHAWLISLIVLGVGVLILGTLHRKLRFRAVHLVVIGAIAAFNKGLSGGGYGPLVTGGQVVSGISAKQAVAVTSLAESLTCVIALGAYTFSGKALAWPIVVPLVLGAAASVPLATLTVSLASERRMRLAVGAMSTVLGLVMIGRIL